MKRHILEITEIDCGDETCEGCNYIYKRRVGIPTLTMCQRFTEMLTYSKEHGPGRLPECLEAERRYDRTLEVDERPWEEGLEPEVTHVTVTPDPKDSIGE